MLEEQEWLQPAHVCLSVCQCLGAVCSALAVHPWWEGRAASTSSTGLTFSRAMEPSRAKAHPWHHGQGKGSLWLCSRLSQRDDMVGAGVSLPRQGSCSAVGMR